MDFPVSVNPRFSTGSPGFRKAQAGFSLVEVLLCMTMVALLMLPFTLVMTSTSQSARAAYLQSSRTILLNTLKNEASPNNPAYVSTFTDGAMNTTFSDSGQVIPYKRLVDATTSGATNAMKRTTLFYIYNNASDATNAARYKSSMVDYPKVFRMRMGSSSDVIDSLNRYWYTDTSGARQYDATSKVPGWTSTYWTSNYWSNDIVNTSGNDDYIFQTETGSPTVNYSMDVENGAYTVKLYFCETNSGNTGTRRAMNITLEGVQMNTDGPYSPYASTGGLNRAEVKMYDTTVSDGVLNVSVSADASATDANVNLHGIEVIKRPIMQ